MIGWRKRKSEAAMLEQANVFMRHLAFHVGNEIQEWSERKLIGYGWMGDDYTISRKKVYKADCLTVALREHSVSGQESHASH